MKTYCPTCEEYVTPEWEDEGIGVYEYWGAPGIDTCMCASCPNCEEPLDADWATECAERDAEAAEAYWDARREDARDSYRI